MKSKWRYSSDGRKLAVLVEVDSNKVLAFVQRAVDGSWNWSTKNYFGNERTRQTAMRTAEEEVNK